MTIPMKSLKTKPSQAIKPQNESGFTLVELMVVVVILGTLIALVGPNIWNMLFQSNTSAAEAQMSNFSGAINNYRLQREESLVERLGEAAASIRESGRPFHMEPMSPRERRIVHLEAENIDGLRTFTMDGSGGKHVVIALDEEAEAAAETPVDSQPKVDEPNGNFDNGSEESNNF